MKSVGEGRTFRQQWESESCWSLASEQSHTGASKLFLGDIIRTLVVRREFSGEASKCQGGLSFPRWSDSRFFVANDGC
jgi:hypothetical protein